MANHVCRLWEFFVMARLLLYIAALCLVTACLPQQPNWYEDRCLRLGFKQGSKAFNDCTARDSAWVEENNRRAAAAAAP